MRSWDDLEQSGKRLHRIIKILETRLKKATDDSTIVSYANSITYVTIQMITIAKLYNGIEDALKEHKELLAQ